MSEERPNVLSEQDNAALAEMLKVLKVLIGDQYDPRSLHAVVALLFSQFAILESEIDSLAATLIEWRGGRMVDIRDKRRVFHLRHWAKLLRQMADKKDDFDLGQFLAELPPVD